MTAVTPTYKGKDVGQLLQSPDRVQVKRVKAVLVRTAASADDGDTLAVTLANYGIGAAGLLAVDGQAHTTLNSVTAVATATSTVTSGVLTLTLDSQHGSDKVRSFLIIGEEA